MTDSSTKSSILLERTPVWGPRLKVLQRKYQFDFVETRVPSEVARLMGQNSHRLLLTVFQNEMTPKQSISQLKWIATLPIRYPNCRVVTCIGSDWMSLSDVCYELGAVVFLPDDQPTEVVQMMQRFHKKFQQQVVPSGEDDSLDWLPW